MRVDSPAMRQNFNAAVKKKFPGLYRHDLLDWRRRVLGLSKKEAADRARLNYTSGLNVFKGKATNKIVFPVAVDLGVHWTAVHDLSPDLDFSSAVVDSRPSAR